MSGSRSNPIDLTEDADGAISMVTFGCDDLFPPPTEIINGVPVYRVERIVGIKRTGAGVFYLVKWFGYPLDESTLEHESQMSQCEEAVAAFRLEQGLDA